MGSWWRQKEARECGERKGRGGMGGTDREGSGRVWKAKTEITISTGSCKRDAFVKQDVMPNGRFDIIY